MRLNSKSESTLKCFWNKTNPQCSQLTFFFLHQEACNRNFLWSINHSNIPASIWAGQTSLPPLQFLTQDTLTGGVLSVWPYNGNLGKINQANKHCFVTTVGNQKMLLKLVLKKQHTLCDWYKCSWQKKMTKKF